MAGNSVLRGSTVTNTGPSTLSGALGVSPAAAIIGFPPGIVAGATHAGDAQALQRQSDLTISPTTSPLFVLERVAASARR